MNFCEFDWVDLNSYHDEKTDRHLNTEFPVHEQGVSLHLLFPGFLSLEFSAYRPCIILVYLYLSGLEHPYKSIVGVFYFKFTCLLTLNWKLIGFWTLTFNLIAHNKSSYKRALAFV